MPADTRSDAINARVKPALKRALVAWARAEDRSLASLIERLLSQAVERNSPKPKKE
jgi:predicted HicB family RNase H-like nuclease